MKKNLEKKLNQKIQKKLKIPTKKTPIVKNPHRKKQNKKLNCNNFFKNIYKSLQDKTCYKNYTGNKYNRNVLNRNILLKIFN